MKEFYENRLKKAEKAYMKLCHVKDWAKVNYELGRIYELKLIISNLKNNERI